MAIIYTYPKLTNPQGNELIVVSDVNNKNSTRLITIQSIADLVPGGGGGGCVDAITGIQTPVGTYNNNLCSTASFTSVNNSVSISNTSSGVNFEANCITNYVLKPSVCTNDNVCSPSQSPAGWLFSCESSLSQYAGTSTPVILTNNGVGIPNDASNESECYFIETWSPVVSLAADCATCCGDEPIVERCLYSKCSSSDEPNMPETVVLNPLNDSCVQVAYVTDTLNNYSCCYTFNSTTTAQATEYLTYISAASCTQSPCQEPIEDTKWVYDVCAGDGEICNEPIVSENPIHSNGSGAFWYQCCFYEVPQQAIKTPLEVNAPLPADIINGVEQDCATFKQNDQIKWLKCGTENEYIYTSCCGNGRDLMLGYTATGFSGPEGCFTIVDVAQGQDTVPCNNIEAVQCSSTLCDGEPTETKWQYKECGQENFIDTSSNLQAYAPTEGETYIWGDQGVCYEIRQNSESSGTGPTLDLSGFRDFTNEEVNDPCDCCLNQFSNYRYEQCSINDPLTGCGQLPNFVVVDTAGDDPAQTILLDFQAGKFTCCYVLVGPTCADADAQVTFTNLSGDCSSNECSGEAPDQNKLYTKCFPADGNTDGNNDGNTDGEIDGEIDGIDEGIDDGIVDGNGDTAVVDGKAGRSVAAIEVTAIEQPNAVDPINTDDGIKDSGVDPIDGNNVNNLGCLGMPPTVVLPSNTVDGVYLVSDTGGNACCYTYLSETSQSSGPYTIVTVDSCFDSSCPGAPTTFKWQFRTCGQTEWNDAGDDLESYVPTVGEDYVFFINGNCTQVQKVSGVIDPLDPQLGISESDTNFSATATPCDCCDNQRNVQYEACDPTVCQIPSPIVVENPNWPAAPPAVTLIENTASGITCCFSSPTTSCQDIEAGYGIPEGAPTITTCQDAACGGGTPVDKFVYQKCSTATSGDCEALDTLITIEIDPATAVDFAIIEFQGKSCCYFKVAGDPGATNAGYTIIGDWLGNCEESLPAACTGSDPEPTLRHVYNKCSGTNTGACEILLGQVIIEGTASVLQTQLKLGLAANNYCCYTKGAQTNLALSNYNIYGTFVDCSESSLGAAGCLSGDVGGGDTGDTGDTGDVGDFDGIIGDPINDGDNNADTGLDEGAGR